MKYIIMCGGEYHEETPRHLRKIGKETIVERTIRLLRENGVTDIAISATSDKFNGYGVPVLRHNNNYGHGGLWIEAFFPTDDPVCYIFGDVIFSERAIQEIVETPTDSIEFFASAPPFTWEYIKSWAEPFALKVEDTKIFKAKMKLCRELAEQGRFKRVIMWELWQVIKGTPLNEIDYTNYHVINDWTCDCDTEEEYQRFLQGVWHD